MSAESEEEKNSKTIKTGQITDITLKSSSAKEQLFKFTAPSAGYYNFFVDGADVNSVKNTIYDSSGNKKQLKQRTYQDKVRYLLFYMEKGQTVYPAVCLDGDAKTGKSVKFGVKKQLWHLSKKRMADIRQRHLRLRQILMETGKPYTYNGSYNQWKFRNGNE